MLPPQGIYNHVSVTPCHCIPLHPETPKSRAVPCPVVTHNRVTPQVSDKLKRVRVLPRKWPVGHCEWSLYDSCWIVHELKGSNLRALHQPLTDNLTFLSFLPLFLLLQFCFCMLHQTRIQQPWSHKNKNHENSRFCTPARSRFPSMLCNLGKCCHLPYIYLPQGALANCLETNNNSSQFFQIFRCMLFKADFEQI